MIDDETDEERIERERLAFFVELALLAIPDYKTFIGFMASYIHAMAANPNHVMGELHDDTERLAQIVAIRDAQEDKPAAEKMH